jgi:protein TonB
VNLRGSSLLFAILNERGEVTEIRIVRPLGAGLDERAVEAVRKWKFAPATKDGKPVPIKINIEVNFR